MTHPTPIGDGPINWKAAAATLIHAADKQRLHLDAILHLDDENPVVSLQTAKEIIRRALKAPHIKVDFIDQCHHCGNFREDTESLLSLRSTLARYAAQGLIPDEQK